MNPIPIHPKEAALAAVLFGGLGIAVFPGSVISILNISALTVAAMAGLYTLSVNVPPTGWLSPFKLMSPFRRRRPHGTLDPIDEKREFARIFSEWRRPLPGTVALPPILVRSLRALLRDALGQRELQVGPNDLSPVSRALLKAEERTGFPGIPWFLPNPTVVASAVHTVLDDVDVLLGQGRPLSNSPDHDSPRSVSERPS